jgi:uncharacterized protein YdaU (DUF1376 family)
MPLYVADYQADTAHLTTTEHGAYLLLIMFYWTKGGLPESEEAIRRVTRMTARQWSQSRDVLRSLFGDEWRHKRIDEELAKAVEKSQVNSANAKRRHSERTADAKRSDTQSQSHKKDAAPAASDPEIDLFRRGRELLGNSAGGLVKQLLQAKGGKITDARAALETAAGKSNPREYLGGVIRKKRDDDQPQWLDGIPGVL